MYIYLSSTMLAGNHIHVAFWVIIYTINTDSTSLLLSCVFYSVKLPFSVFTLYVETNKGK
uniref:Uncharacterized protein n=1 Tax=Arundo donax TaxID=35708 RepID=A0A0A9APP8_ARUDO